MHWGAIGVIGLVGLLSSSTPAAALAITGNFLPSSAIGPDNSPAAGGGNIQDVFAAAAALWEGAILDPVSVVIDFEWVDGGGFLAFAVGDSRSGYIGVLNGHDWFVDATPAVSEEYASATFAQASYGGTILSSNVGFTDGIGPADGTDLFSVLVHEIGHVLGNRPETFGDYLDGFVTVTAPRPHAGVALTVAGGCCHLNDGDGVVGFNPLMFPSMGGGDRMLISAADLLFVAQGGLWEQLDESRFAAVPEPGMLALLGVGMAGFAFRRRVSGR